MAKKTYYTKADMLSFAKHIVSDERRLQKQIECREKIRKGTVNPIPWSIAERIVTVDDFNNWKDQQN